MNDLDRLYVNDENEYFIAHDATSYRLDSFVEDFNEFGSFECYHDIIINKIVDKYFRKLNAHDQIELYTSLSEKDLSTYYKFPSLYDLAGQYIIEEILNIEEDVDDFTNNPDNYWITPQTIINEYNSIKPSHHRIAFREYASDYAYQNIKRLLTIYDSKQLIQNKRFDVLDHALNFLKNHLTDFYYKKVFDKEEYET